MNRSFQMSEVSGQLVQEGETHGVMGVGNWKSNRMME
jgi:hypothetical protein